MEQTGCSETSTYKIQTPGNYPEEKLQDLEKGENLKSRKLRFPNVYLQFIALLKPAILSGSLILKASYTTEEQTHVMIYRMI
jgi:hypothetical protein